MNWAVVLWGGFPFSEATCCENHPCVHYPLNLPTIYTARRAKTVTKSLRIMNPRERQIFPSSPTNQIRIRKPRKSTSGHHNSQNRRPSDAARSSTSSSGNSTSTKNDENKLQREPAGSSLELARISNSHQRENENKATVNLKLTGNLLTNNSPRTSVTKKVESVPKSKELNSVTSSHNNAGMGNIMRKNTDELAQLRRQRIRIDPEVLKAEGNEAYKQGKFEEALSLYDRAILLDSSKPTYHCNKSAALMGLGRLPEAMVECEEAIRLEPSYTRAHHRLAAIYLRLGEAEKAMHCNNSTPYGDSVLAFQAQALQKHVKKCLEARKVNEWNTILKETQYAISLCADSAPQVYALLTEALLKLLKHGEASSTYEKLPKFELDWSIKIFGVPHTAYLLIVGAQVQLAAGRFDDAVTAAQQAAELDPTNKEVNAAVRKTRAVRSARMSGNILFKASKFMEACGFYSEGLEHDPFNSVLLCNRAACRSKLGQFEKAIEDCSAALAVQPYYSKARLRRANCNAKLERWGAAIQDYEMLMREKPGDEEVARALFEAQLQLKMLRGEDIKDLKFGSNLVFISSNDRFRHYVTLPGMSVVLFCNKATHKQVLLVLEQTCKRFPSINFLKVEIEDHPYLAKSEGVSSVPAFRIYKNGSRVKEIPGNKHELLERSVKLYTG
ncbi:TPR repeat-containing thioredoxin TTL1-like [Prosopis cineraria]|uniref:TPR repeat-containing thioredoxin TTL1-like n=1 Tax=Prosopis cineraria TaxID=364024 RepID=UPI00240ED391|nr:TPR repeat-containing thioredoxin TTL1-like [Prosopis cineraria]